jgi:hypothetical protein
VKPEDLFLDTLEDLRRRCDLRASEYDMVQVAGLVRRLLFDGRPLWVEANQSYGFRPVYAWSGVRVATSGEGGRAPAWVAMHWLDPMLKDLLIRARVSPTEVDTALVEPRTGNLSTFRQHDVIVSGEQRVSVQDVITHYANREGGVHYDSRPARSSLLADLLPERDLALRLTVLAVGRIVHRSLEPLGAQIALSRNPHPYGLGEDFVMNVVREDAHG